jgi:hypothetical protein
MGMANDGTAYHEAPALSLNARLQNQNGVFGYFVCSSVTALWLNSFIFHGFR